MKSTAKSRILRQARQAIESGAVRHICVALDNIADRDHRRAVQNHCRQLRALFQCGLDGRDNLVGWLIDQRNTRRLNLPIDPNTLQLARLAWIDRTLETLQ